MKNRFMLAPLTNKQSHQDGRLSDDEFHWLTMRAKGGFGLTMTSAVHIQANGKGFEGQLGLFADRHIQGHHRLTTAIRRESSLSIVQLHHAGIRAPASLISERPVGPSADAETGARALLLKEVEQLRDDYIQAAMRAEKAGYDGVELHGAHGYMLCQFLSPKYNHRTDRYGGSLENRMRLLDEIIDGIRAHCKSDLTLGVRLSPERFGMKLLEVKDVSQHLINSGKVDFLDISLWDVFKEPEELEHKGSSLLSFFTGLQRQDVLLTVAGKIYHPQDALRCFASGVDFITLGRAAILHHDYPIRLAQDHSFVPVQLPVTSDYLRDEGLGESFIHYLHAWSGFIED